MVSDWTKAFSSVSVLVCSGFGLVSGDAVMLRWVMAFGCYDYSVCLYFFFYSYSYASLCLVGSFFA